jgi:hypothetical protein
VLLLAARYGTKGLCLSLLFSAAAVAAAAVTLGEMRALGERLDGGADLVALVAALLVGWVASTQESRRDELACALDAVKNRSLADRQAAREMQNALVALRSRADRMNLSLTFLRNVAQRLEKRDPEEAAGAALTLAMSCLEARAGVVQLVGQSSADTRAATPNMGPSLLCWSGPWNSDGAAPALEGDRVVATALEGRRAVRAIDVDGAGIGDADMAAPLLDRHGEAFGVMAVCGLPYETPTMMALQDLAVAAGWLAGVLTTSPPASAEETESSAEIGTGEAPYADLTISPAPAPEEESCNHSEAQS